MLSPFPDNPSDSVGFTIRFAGVVTKTYSWDTVSVGNGGTDVTVTLKQAGGFRVIGGTVGSTSVTSQLGGSEFKGNFCGLMREDASGGKQPDAR